MTTQEFAQKIKTKYPQYAGLDDQTLTSKIIQKYPQYKSQVEQPTDYKQVIGQSMKDVFQKPAAFAKDLGTNPQSMANAMPAVLGTAGGISPIPGGATMFTAAGQGIRDLSLMGLKKPVPSGLQHGLELGGAALGDVMAIPAIKGKMFGSQIGQAEKGAGVVARGAEKAITPGSVGQTLRDLEAQIDVGTINTPQGAKDAQEIIAQIYKNPRIYEKSPGIEVQSQRVSAKVQDLLNSLIKGRQEPAQALGKAMTIPRLGQQAWKAVPMRAKQGLGIAGAGGLGAAGWEAIRKLMGQ